jgi:hypothetical protein
MKTILPLILLFIAVFGAIADPRDSARNLQINTPFVFNGVDVIINNCQFKVQEIGIAAISRDRKKIAISIGKGNRPDKCTLPYGVYLIDLVSNSVFLLLDTTDDPFNWDIEWQPDGHIFMVDGGSSPLRGKTLFDSESRNYLGHIITLADQYVWGDNLLLYTSYAEIKDKCAFRGFGETFGLYCATLPDLEIYPILKPDDWQEYEIISKDVNNITVRSLEIERISNCISPRLQAAWVEFIYVDHAGSIIEKQVPDGLIGTIEVNTLRIRQGPSLEYPIVASLVLGEKVHIRNRSEEKETIDGFTTYWYQVDTDDGRRGWCFGHYVRLAIPR